MVESPNGQGLAYYSTVPCLVGENLVDNRRAQLASLRTGPQCSNILPNVKQT